MPPRDRLHDAIDAQEELMEEASAIVDRLRPKLPDIVKSLVENMDADELDAREGADVVQEALEVLAAAVGRDLAPLTTKAVRQFAAMAREGVEESKQG